MSEHGEQVVLFQWAVGYESQVPELRLLFAVPNAGKRSAWEAAERLSEGLKRGVLDVNLPVARQGFHTLWIEMKFGDNKLTKIDRKTGRWGQEEWVAALRAEGHRVEVCYGAEAAADVIIDYLGLPERFRMASFTW